MNMRRAVSCALAVLLFACGASADTTVAQQKYVTPAWVLRSNENAKILLDQIGRFAPETASRLGLEGHDAEIIDLTPGVEQRQRQATGEALSALEKKLAREKDVAVHQDLEILVKAAKDHIKEIDLQEKYDVPYLNLPRLVFFGIRSVLDDQVAPERRQSALLRLRRYAGMESGYTPISTVVEQRTLAKLNKPGLLPPSKAEVEKDLSTGTFFIDGIGPLFEKYKIEGYQEPYAKLKEQMAAYDKFIREQVLPKARSDFRIPAEEYAFQLEQVGVDIPPDQLMKMAHAGFDEIQRQMQALAPTVAKQHHIQATDYRDVIRALKKDQIVGDSILPHYQARLKEIEAIIRREHLLTLPARDARIRLATAAESAATPAPNMRPPRLLGNTGEIGEFVLPLNIPAAPGSKEATRSSTILPSRQPRGL